ncbi:MAG: ATP-binding protein [Actinomycetota bacterium]|nr:ATP-binding protein [Actinomycetota bacterium]
MVGHGSIVGHDQGFIGPARIVRAAAATSLRKALERFQHMESPGDVEVLLTDDEPPHLDPDTSAVHGSSLALRSGELLVETVAYFGEPPDEADVERIAGDAAERRRAALVGTSVSHQQAGWIVFLTLRVPTRGRTAGDMFDVADHVAAVVQAVADGDHTPATTAELVRDGLAEIFVGRYEADWLEAKRAPYRLEEAAGRFELAKDVAMLANARGGVILVGAKTKRGPGGRDRIKAINGCRRADIKPERYRQEIRRQIHPAPDGVTVELHEQRAGQLLGLIVVPEQEASRKPFLVVGRVDDGHYEGLAFTWVTREGEHASAPRAESVHALLRAGQRWLDGEAESTPSATTAAAADDLEELRADVRDLRDAAYPPWLADVVRAARDDGFDVVGGVDSVKFAKVGHENVTASTVSPGGPVDAAARQRLLERLRDAGLPVHTTARGFLAPRWTADDSV